MSQERLQAELLEAKKEIERLKERALKSSTQTVNKDLSLISVIPKWSGCDDTVTIEEFLESIKAAAKIGRWNENDRREVEVLSLTGSAKLFYKCCDELHEEGATWETFKEAFGQRYRDIHTDQFHFTQLQTARQARNENPQQFADRCRSLARKVMLKLADPQIQRIHKENTDRMLLASFVSGLGGSVGHHVRISCPRSLPEALNLALAVQEAERQERSNGSFYAKSEKSVRSRSEPEDRQHPINRNRRNQEKHARSQRQSTPDSKNKVEQSETRKTKSETTFRCYECDGRGHFAKECPTRLKKEKKLSDSPGRKNPSERSKRSHVPGDKQRNGTFGKRERGVEDDSSHRLTVPEKAVTVSKVTTDMEHGTPIIKADIEGVEWSLIVDTGSDVSILQPGISKASIRNTTLRPYGVSGETLDVKGRQTVSLSLGERKFDHTSLVCPLPTEAAELLGTDFLEGRGDPHKF